MSRLGSAVSKPGDVGEQHEELGADQVRHEGGQAVVVAEADLLVGHRVVLVDDRDHAKVDQMAQGPARVQVLGAVHEVERRQQHLAGEEAVRLEAVLPEPHEAMLADGRDGLQHGRIRRPLFPAAQGRPAGGDGAGGDDHDGVTAVAHRGQLGTQAVHGVGRDR